MATTASKAPTGLKITRNGNKFVCEWKIPSAKYGDGQNFKAKTANSADKSITVSSGGTTVANLSKTEIGKTATSKTITVDLDAKYPVGGKCGKFAFYVRGNSDPKNDSKGWSDWAGKEFKLYAPKLKDLTKEKSSTYGCKFSWEIDDATKDSHYPFKKIVIYTALVQNMTYAVSQVTSWEPYIANNSGEYNSSQSSGYTSSASGWVQIEENTGRMASGNYTRCIKIVAQGCAGEAVKYISHSYGTPKESEQSGGVTKDTSGGYDVTVNWDTSYDASTPIDSTEVQWVITEPESDMSCPSGVSWNTGAADLRDTSGKESVHISIDATVGYNKCLFTRVNTIYDGRTTYGKAVLQKVGKLAAPSGLSVENLDQETRSAKISATNNSTAIDGTVIEIIFRKNGSDTIVGLITASDPGYKTVKCPAWEDDDTVQFGVRTVLPKSTSSYTDDGVTIYTIDPYMESDNVWQSGSVAVAPTGLALSMDGEDIRASWRNNWDDANIIELSWSDNQNAWESTDAPNTFEIGNPFITSWRIAGCEAGKPWYVKVRSIFDSGNGKTYSPYSAIATINLSSSPDTPALALSRGIVAVGEGLTASWEYGSTDGTPQAYARLYEFLNGEYTEIGRALTEEHIDLSGWDTPGERLLCVEVVSDSGENSSVSAPVPVMVAEPITCSMTNSLEEVTVIDEDEEERDVTALTELPLTVNISGIGLGGKISAVIERTEDYHVERPDENDLDGSEGEIVYTGTQDNDGTISITPEDLLGSLDDGATYRLTARVTDNIGQVAEQTEDFTVMWSHKAIMPVGEVFIDDDDRMAILRPILPEEAPETDTCDIYRLSVDKPALVYKGARFGERYVDPYPAIGEQGGYRFVYKTPDGCYTTEDGVIAFYDEEDEHLDEKCVIINFGRDRVELKYNVALDSDWEKNFTRKEFLGGSEKGYWRAGVGRKGSVDAVEVPMNEEGLLSGMRRLSEYAGICHIRTPEGSSFAADIQVSESWTHETAGKIAKFALKITRVEPESQDGITYEEWSER